MPLAWPTGPAAPPLREAWRSAQRLWARARQPDVMTPLALAFAIRLVVMVVATAAMEWYFAPRNPGKFAGLTIQDFWDRKDAFWYLSIAEHGYTYSTVGQSSANFYPLYPMLVAFFGAVARTLGVPTPYTVAGVAISWVSFLPACVILYKLAERRFNSKVALGGVLLFAVYPFSFYYGLVYTESLFILLTAGAFLAMESRHWVLACALAGIAGAERPTGIVVGGCIGLAYLIMYLRERRWLRWDMLSLLLLPTGYLSYMLYCWVRFGDPFAASKASRVGWGQGLQINGALWAWDMIRDPTNWSIIRHPKAWLNPGYVMVTVDFAYLGIALLMLLTLPFVWRRMGLPYAAYLFLGVLAPIIMFPATYSLGRPLGMLFPAFFAYAYGLRRWPIVTYGLSLFCLVAMCIYAAFFMTGLGLS